MRVIEEVTIIVMSGVDDGSEIILQATSDGQQQEGAWVLRLGRKDDNDLCLRNDTYVSRDHAILIWRAGSWWLEDNDSTNGTFIEKEEDFFADERVYDRIPLDPEQLFCIGRTWLQIRAD